jgi:hypothetical protein
VKRPSNIHASSTLTKLASASALHDLEGFAGCIGHNTLEIGSCIPALTNRGCLTNSGFHPAGQE